MATPSSPPRSDTEPASSPVHKSFATSGRYTHASDDEGTPSAAADRANATWAGSERPKGAARKRNANGKPPGVKDPSMIGKIRHLKKEDGEPLWRSDIQYDFLRAIFDDPREVFTNSYDDRLPKQKFADLYIDTMSRSSKTSKILHDKLLSDREAAINMAMVCLLVNIGRMNTTLNFFPEMRAQLRTYHAIPSLQVDESVTDYKQLQDAPRLKSILKGGTEDRDEPRTLEDLKGLGVPRTNPVNLLFLICNNAAKVAELHFPPNHEFHDLIMRSDLSSRSRARAFLWVLWFYLESDFTEEGCDENPFGAGVDYGVDVANQGVPKMVPLSLEEIARENVDTPNEIEFGLGRKAFRQKILNNEAFPEIKRSSRPSRPSGSAQAIAAAAKEAIAAREASLLEADADRSATPNILPRIRPSKHESDMDSVRSTPPPRSVGGRAGGSIPGTSGFSTFRRGGAGKAQLGDGAPPARQPPLLQQLYQQQMLQNSSKRRRTQRGLADDDDDERVNTLLTAGGRKPRPPTAHQIAVETNRKQRIEYLLSRGMHRKQHRSRKARRNEGAIIRAQRRLEKVVDPFDDSENEDHLMFNRNMYGTAPGSAQIMPSGTAFRERGFYGLVQLSTEVEDYGEEFEIYSAAMRRACRRINRWQDDSTLAVVPTIKRPRVNVPIQEEYRDPNETEDDDDEKMDGDLTFIDATPAPKRRRAAGPVASGNRPRGGRGTGKPTGAGSLGGSSASTMRRRAAAAKAAALAASNSNGAEANGDVTMDDADDGDEDRGIKRDADDDDNDDLNDVEKTLLGMGGESDSE